MSLIQQKMLKTEKVKEKEVCTFKERNFRVALCH